MENEKKYEDKYVIPMAIVIAGVLISGTVWYKDSAVKDSAQGTNSHPAKTTQASIVDGGRILPLETEKKILADLVANGSIDPSQLSQVTELNLLWAFGLVNKNPVLENGPIMDARYGGPTNMASVGGWTVTKGSVMDHYSKHALAILTTEEQQLVERMAKGIYRPCCSNSTHFPDCNHGMAMLGLLEFLASSGVTEEEMWNTALTANMIWFPDTYQTIGQYLKQKGVDLKSVNPQELLGINYSSAQGFARIASQVTTPSSGSRGGESGCGVDARGSALTPRQQGGCGI